jgi:hypothetical protein
MAEVETQLRARNVRVSTDAASSDAGRAEVHLTCSANVRDRVCSADIRHGTVREVAIAWRPRETVAPPTNAPSLAALEVQPLFAGRHPILDVLALGERLLVLDVTGLTLYEHGNSTWQAKAFAPLSANRAWPRDVRGRLLVDGTTISAFLPGLSCRGTTEPLAVSCAEARPDWPTGIANATLADTGNYFTSPKTPPFFTAAPAGAALGWLIAATDGRLLLLDQAWGVRAALPAIGDDIAGIDTSCGGGRQIIAARPDRDDTAGDALRAFELLDDDLVAFTPSVPMNGAVTAMWQAPGRSRVLVVVRNRASDRYEAFLVGISCAR